MARIELKSLAVGVVQNRRGDVLSDIPFTCTASVYAAATGDTQITGGNLKTTIDGELPGWLESGVHTITIPAVSKSVTFEVGNNGIVNGAARVASLESGQAWADPTPGDVLTYGTPPVWAPPSGGSGDPAAHTRINARPIHSSDYADLAAAVLDAGGINGPQVVVGRGAHNIDELVLPTAGDTQTVGLKGEGYIVTKLKQTVDRGADTFIVKAAGDPLQTQCVIEDLRVVGPNETYAVGVAPCAMEGIQVSGRMHLDKIGVSHCKAGVRVISDHITMRRSVFALNYYGLLSKNAATSGDINLHDCDLSNCAFASIAVEATGFLAGFTMYGGHIGVAPYGIYIGPGVAASAASYTALAMLFDRTSFELHGNGIVYDEDALGYMQDITFRDCGDFNLDDLRYISARGRPALFRAGSMRLWNFQGAVSCATLGGPLADRLFHAAGAGSEGIQGMRFDVNLARMFGAYAGKRLFCQPTFPGNSPHEVARISGSHRGLVKGTMAAVDKGRIVESQQYQLCRHAVGGSGNDLLGVAYANTLANDAVLILQEGSRVPVVVGDALATHERVVVNQYDHSQGGSLTVHPAQPVIGQHWYSTFAGGGFAEVDLRMPRG